jgi:hypothetical protein
LAAWWAAVRSIGRSALTPVAVGFAVAIAVAAARRHWPSAGSAPISTWAEAAADGSARKGSRHGRAILTGAAAAIFIIAVALLYGSTMAPSPRNGVQPVEFMDEAYYSVMGSDLAAAGTETIYSPSGFAQLDGLPIQTWYHWGELWLASAAITIFGAAPMAARYFVVLPVLLLAAAAMTGTVVRRMARTSSTAAYLFGCLACVFLAPIPLIPGPFFSSWAVGLVFGITEYGLAAVAVLLALYVWAVLDHRKATGALVLFAGSAVASIVPAHIVIALLAVMGVGSVWMIRAIQAARSAGRLPTFSPVWRRTLLMTGILIATTVAWGLLTGHGIGTSALSPGVSPFNASWGDTLAITTLGAGAFLAIGFAWPIARSHGLDQADLYIGTVVLLVVGAIAWGARLGDFTMFYVFFGGIAVFATPAAAVAVWTLRDHLHEAQHLGLVAGLMVVCVIQLGIGVVAGVVRLQEFGPHDYDPIAVDMLRAIEQLPANAELAYACKPFEEVSFSDPRLESIDAHAGRRVVPMCFEAESLSVMVGAHPSLSVPDAFFRWAPQRILYPDAAANPSSGAVAAFLKDHGIDYIYADAQHPNSLVADAIPIATSADGEILKVP